LGGGGERKPLPSPASLNSTIPPPLPSPYGCEAGEGGRHHKGVVSP